MAPTLGCRITYLTMPWSFANIDRPFHKVCTANTYLWHHNDFGKGPLWSVVHLVWLVVSSLFCLFQYLPLLWRSQPMRSTTKDVTLLPICVCKHFGGFTYFVGLAWGMHSLECWKKNAKQTTWGCWWSSSPKKNAPNGANNRNKGDILNPPRLLALHQLPCTQLARKKLSIRSFHKGLWVKSYGCRSFQDSPTNHGCIPRNVRTNYGDLSNTKRCHEPMELWSLTRWSSTISQNMHLYPPTP